MTPPPDLGAVVTNARDRAFAELERAGVIKRADFVDANGNLVYRLLGFPSGAEGVRLKALFARHVQEGKADPAR
jgi:hypothetical protein